MNKVTLKISDSRTYFKTFYQHILYFLANFVDMKRILFIQLIISFCIFSGFSQISEAVDTLFEEDPYFLLMGEAELAIKDENWTEAAARLEDALAVKPNHPSNALLYSNLGGVYVAMREDSLALENYTKALEIAPNMLTPMVGRGRLLLAMGRDKEAFADFSHAIEVDSINTDARYYHGMMSLYGGILAMAEEDFAILESIAPRSTDTAVALSTLYSMTGRDAEAIPYLKKLVENTPSPEFYSNLAGCYLKLDRLNEASETISDGLKLYPDDPELYYYRAWLNRERYRLDDAHNDAKKAIKLGANPVKIDELFRKQGN